MIDFCKKLILKLLLIIIDDVVQKFVEIMVDVVGENIRCYEEIKKIWVRMIVQKMRMKIDFYQLMSLMMIVEI